MRTLDPALRAGLEDDAERALPMSAWPLAIGSITSRRAPARRRVRHVAVAIAAFLSAGCGAVERTDGEGLRASVDAEVRRVLAETSIPAISLAVVRDGDVLWSDAWGLANVGASVPATTESYFSTGSTFKLVTATAIMQLIERGHFTLDTPFNEVVGSELAIDGADDVTFRHMLSHHSGLEGPITTVPLWGRSAPSTVTELIRGIERTGPPGQEYRYCNECYGAMAHVIESISGKAYDAFVADHILGPLGVPSRTPTSPSPEQVEQMALPYTIDQDGPRPVQQIRFDVYAAGDAWLRSEDMGRFLAAHLNDGALGDARILSRESAQEMHRQQFADEEYGLGTGVYEEDGRLLLTHSGSIPGFNAYSIGELGAGRGVYVMANASGPASMNGIIGLARFVLGLLADAESP